VPAQANACGYIYRLPKVLSFYSPLPLQKQDTLGSKKGNLRIMNNLIFEKNMCYHGETQTDSV
jgi:hypothetical protein